jgi:DNA polymerase III subunit alpha
LEDTSGAAELVVFPDVFASSEGTLKCDRALIVTGALEVDGPKVKILVEKVQRAEDILKQTKRLVLKLGSEHESKLALLRELFVQHPGKTQCSFAVRLNDLDRVVEMQMKNPQGVEPTAEFFEKVSAIIETPEWSFH